MNKSLVYYGDLASGISGDIALSAMGVVTKIAMIMGAFGVGVGIGAQPILGYNRGARKFDRIRRTYLMAVIFATVLIFVCWIFCLRPSSVSLATTTQASAILQSSACVFTCSASSAQASRSSRPAISRRPDSRSRHPSCLCSVSFCCSFRSCSFCRCSSASTAFCIRLPSLTQARQSSSLASLCLRCASSTVRCMRSICTARYKEKRYYDPTFLRGIIFYP